MALDKYTKAQFVSPNNELNGVLDKVNKRKLDNDRDTIGTNNDNTMLESCVYYLEFTNGRERNVL